MDRGVRVLVTLHMEVKKFVNDFVWAQLAFFDHFLVALFKSLLHLFFHLHEVYVEDETVVVVLPHLGEVVLEERHPLICRALDGP